MARYGKWVAAAAALAAALGSGCEGDTVLSAEGVAGEDRIFVSGSATVDVAPDVALATVGVQTFDADAAIAVGANSEKTAAVLAAVKALGVAEEDLQTTGFSVWPQRAYEKDRPDSITGYLVNNTVSVTVRRLADTGAVLQAAIDAGANEVYGLQFTVSNPDSIQDVARQEAVADARRRARVIAEAAGVKLGRVVTITESSVSAPPYARGAAEADLSGAVPVQPGEVEVTAYVTAVFAIDG